jgi:opacity protein-like surface antigen
LSAWTDRGPRFTHRRAAAALAALLGALAWPGAARAQDTTVVAPAPAAQPPVRRASIFELLNLDRLQLTSLGASAGGVRPADVVPTQLYSVQADYGEIADRVRIVFVATYWGSQYTSRSIRDFEEALGSVVRDPAGDDTIRVGTMRVQDLSLGVDVRWLRWGSGIVRPFVGGGLSTHLVNAEGSAVSGTFVERSLDNIAAGVAALGGVDVALLPNLTLEMQARYDLFSGVRHGSVRAGASYVFDAVRGPASRGRRDR